MTALTPALSCRSLRPNAPFAELVCLSKASVAKEYYTKRSGNRAFTVGVLGMVETHHRVSNGAWQRAALIRAQIIGAGPGGACTGRFATRDRRIRPSFGGHACSCDTKARRPAGRQWNWDSRGMTLSTGWRDEFAQSRDYARCDAITLPKDSLSARFVGGAALACFATAYILSVTNFRDRQLSHCVSSFNHPVID